MEAGAAVKNISCSVQQYLYKGHLSLLVYGCSIVVFLWLKSQHMSDEQFSHLFGASQVQRPQQCPSFAPPSISEILFG